MWLTGEAERGVEVARGVGEGVFLLLGGVHLSSAVEDASEEREGEGVGVYSHQLKMSFSMVMGNRMAGPVGEGVRGRAEEEMRGGSSGAEEEHEEEEGTCRTAGSLLAVSLIGGKPMAPKGMLYPPSDMRCHSGGLTIGAAAVAVAAAATSL